MRGGEAGVEEPPDDRERERDLAGHLPPVDVVRDGRDVAPEGRQELVERPKRGDADGDEERHEDPPRARRRTHELPEQQHDEARGQEAEEHDHVGLLEHLRQVRVRAHEDRALRGERRVLQPRALGRHQEDREREGEHRRVPDPDEQQLPAVDDPARRVRERDVPEQREAEPSQQEADREHPRLGAVLPGSDQDREAEERHQQAHPIRRPLPPGEQPGRDRRPADDHGREGPNLGLVEVAVEQAEGHHAERDRNHREGDLERLHRRRSRAARTASPVSWSFGMNASAPLRPRRPATSARSRLETSRTSEIGLSSGTRSRPLASAVGRRAARGRAEAARPRRAPRRRPRPHRSRRTPRARAAFVPSAGTAHGRPRSRRSGASGESSHAREPPATGLTRAWQPTIVSGSTLRPQLHRAHDAPFPRCAQPPPACGLAAR